MLHMNIKRFRFVNNSFFALFLVFALILPIPTRIHAAPETMPAAASLPQEANAPISAAIGADQPSYHATADRDGFHMDNAQGLSAQFTSSGVDFKIGEHTWGLSLASYGYGDTLQPVDSSGPTARDNRIEYSRGYLIEWYVNGPFGLEQGFTLAVPPTGRSGGPLTLALSISGDLQAAVDEDGNGLSLSTSDGPPLLRYTGLTAYDVEGNSLSAWLETQLNPHSNLPSLFLHVNDIGARYPLTIDPFVQLAKMTASDKSVDAFFGWSVAVSGNVVVVGAIYADPGSTTDAGEAYVFVKSVSGWGNMTESAKLIASDRADGDQFGRSVAISGDVIVVGAYFADLESLSNAGAAYVFVKPVGGWSGVMEEDAKLTASNKSADAHFGISMAMSGEVIVVGADLAESNGSGEGAAYIFLKPVGGWTGDLTQSAMLSSSSSGNAFGKAVAIDGDIIVVGEPGFDEPTGDAGAANVFVKPIGGWSDMTETARLTRMTGNNDYLGTSVSVSGDVVVAGIPSYIPVGAAAVYVKPKGGWVDMTPTALLTPSNQLNDEEFGYTMAVHGDVILAGAEDAKSGGIYRGAVYVYLKPAGGWVDKTQNYRFTAVDKADNDHFGNSVAMSGGTAVIGAYLADTGGLSNAGKAYVFLYGSTTNITSDIPDPSIIGQNVKVSVKVSGSGPMPTGKVNITGANTNCSLTLSGGMGSCNVVFNTPGMKTITATYVGNSTYLKSKDTESHTVHRANTTTTIIADTPDPSSKNQPVTVGVTVFGGTTTPTGTVSITGADANCVITLSSGSGTCNVIFTSYGSKTLKATYNGDSLHKISLDTEHHEVNLFSSTYISQGIYDGWILESSELSNKGGSYNSTDDIFILGDDSTDRQYRSILSFNTAGHLTNAIVKSVRLKIKKQVLVGINPFTTHQGLTVDIRTPYFGTALALSPDDFQAVSSKFAIGTFNTTPAAGWYSFTLDAGYFPYINKTPQPQFRLRFKLDDDNDNLADYMKFFSGNYTTTSYRPKLIIQYYLP